MEFYSHPNKLLRQHLIEVRDYFARLYPQGGFLNVVALTHDFGKYTTFFQNKLLCGTGVNDPKTYHSFLSAVFTYYILVKMGFPQKECVLGYMLVYNHHRYIRSLQEMFLKSAVADDDNSFAFLREQLLDLLQNKDIIEAEYRQFGINFSLQEFADWVLEQDGDFLAISIKLSRLYRKEVSRNKELYHKEFLRYFVQLVQADAYSAADIDFELRYDFITPEELEGTLEEINRSNFTPLNRVRNAIREEALERLKVADIARNKFFFINAFTGSGKTLMSFSVALELAKMKKELGCKHVKIIYSLPFINIITQTYDLFRGIIKSHIDPKEFEKYESHYILQHFYLSDSVYRDEERRNLEPIDNKLIIDNFESNLIVTTFVQLFNTLYSNQNSNLSKLAGMKDSIIVLDEVQNFRVEHWGLIEKVLEFWAENLNIHFILMTATKPILFDGKAVTLVEAGFNRLPSSRVRLHYDPAPRTVEEFAKWFIENDYEKNDIRSYLLVLNTIDSSKELFKALKRKVKKARIFYLSNNITAVEKAVRLANAKMELAKGSRVMVVSTQVIEAGVDISFERIYRDIASLDSILQCAGRANRNGDGDIADVIVVNLICEMKNGGVCPYAEFIYGKIHLDETREVLKKALRNKPFLTDKEDFDTMIEDYFKALKYRYRDLTEEQGEKLWEAYLNFDAEMMRKFSIIEETGDKVTLFLEINEEAKRIYDAYRSKVLGEKDYRKRQNAFLKIRQALNKYIVNIYETKFEKLEISRFMPAIERYSQGPNGEEPEILAVPYDIVRSIYDLGDDLIDASYGIFADGVGLL